MTVGIEYTRTFPFAERTKAIGEQIRQELDGISSAFTLTDSIVSRAILLPTGVTGTNIPSAVEDRANQVIGFDIAGNLQLQPGVGRYRGAWATGTAYKIRDVFKDTVGTIGLNNLYIVTAPHTSTTLATDAANYTLLIGVAEVEAAKVAAQAAQAGAELAETNAASNATQALASEDAAALSETAAAADATQTALDRVATGNDASATAADRVQTGLDADATAADRVQTGLDADATAADRVQTGLDADATAADRVQTGIDASSASASELDAESAAAASIFALAEFRGDWLGELAADPSVDGNGDPLDGGEIYFNTTSSVYRVYVSALAQWVNLPTYLNATETNPGVVEKATINESDNGTADKYPDAAGVLSSISQSVMQKSGSWMTYGGTANAITLTTTTDRAVTAYVDGAQYRFKATATNTGAATLSIDGLTAKPILTITNVALPAGYIRTSVETVVRYDAGLDSFIADRQVERGENANGDYVKYADGTLIASKTATPVSNNNAGTLSSLAATFSSPPVVVAVSGAIAASALQGSYVVETGEVTTTAVRIKILLHLESTITGSSSVAIKLVATGRWF